MAVLEINDLTKTYKNGKGIFNVSFRVKDGEVFGYLGPNGAGKTTTIRQIMGFTNSDSGRCTVNGMDSRVYASDIQKDVGYIPGEMAFLEGMTGTQFFRFMSEMRRTEDRSLLNKLIEIFDLEPDRKIKKMSKGMKQKLGLITAFMHDPDVYILDEPTSGLDPLMQKIFIDLILEEKERGKTILMSSHSFEEVERTSDRAGVIREGKLVAVEDVNSLKASQRKIYVVSVAGQDDIDKLKTSNLELEKITGNIVEVVVSSNYNEFVAALSQCNVRGIDIVSQSLEQVFMHYYGQEVV